MEYPQELYSNGRSKCKNEEIKNEHFLYMRHLPGHSWKTEEGIPDYNTIKLDYSNRDANQSCNWDKYSEPHWVRFDIEKNYRIDNAVVGYLVNIIRNLNSFKPEVPADIVDVEHDPIDQNYSHCQLLCLRKFSKSEKRALRMEFRHGAKVYLLPNSDKLITKS